MDKQDLFVAKMRQDGLPEFAISLFCHYYRQLVDGADGYIRTEEARPVPQVPSRHALGAAELAAGRDLLDRVVIWKLNGGLGTTMGLHGPKSGLLAKGGLTFLDLLVRQILYQRRQLGARLPLVLMDSLRTQDATLSALAYYPEFHQDIRVRFLQHRIPKVLAEDLTPVRWPQDPAKEWCPPGHGDLFAAVATSGALDEILDAGYEYAFVSNADNLGAVLDPRILGYVGRRQIPFLMEVAMRTHSDRKGGHLALRPDGQLILREVAQCPPEEVDSFQDVDRYRFFNTNNLWLHLPSLRTLLEERGGVLGLPLIRNAKPVDPADLTSPQVYHLETAMGAALGVFPKAEALLVPRSRFIPVKKTDDLLLLWSDAYRLGPGYQVRLARRQAGFLDSVPPRVELDSRFFRCVGDLQARFPGGPPSLAECRELKVTGDVVFGRDVAVVGSAHVINRGSRPLRIPDGAVLSGVVRAAAPPARVPARLVEEGADAVGLPVHRR